MKFPDHFLSEIMKNDPSFQFLLATDEFDQTAYKKQIIIIFLPISFSPENRMACSAFFRMEGNLMRRVLESSQLPERISGNFSIYKLLNAVENLIIRHGPFHNIIRMCLPVSALYDEIQPFFIHTFKC